MSAPARVEPPEPDADSAEFWEGLRRERITLPRCADCGRLRFPPIGRCPWCASAASTTATVDGAGVVYSWIVVHRAFQPALRDEVPYVVATVDLDAGPRMALRLDEADPSVDFGLRVRPRFVHHPGWTELRMVPDA